MFLAPAQIHIAEYMKMTYIHVNTGICTLLQKVVVRVDLELVERGKRRERERERERGGGGGELEGEDRRESSAFSHTSITLMALTATYINEDTRRTSIMERHPLEISSLPCILDTS